MHTTMSKETWIQNQVTHEAFWMATGNLLSFCRIYFIVWDNLVYTSLSCFSFLFFLNKGRGLCTYEIQDVGCPGLLISLCPIHCCCECRMWMHLQWQWSFPMGVFCILHSIRCTPPPLLAVSARGCWRASSKICHSYSVIMHLSFQKIVAKQVWKRAYQGQGRDNGSIMPCRCFLRISSLVTKAGKKSLHGSNQE